MIIPPEAGLLFKEINMNFQIAVVGLWALDVPACAHFYRGVIGLELIPLHAGEHPHFNLSGSYLTIIQGHPAIPPDPEPRFPVVTFSIQDLDSAIEKLRFHGVDMPWGVESNASGRWVMFHDPAGNLVELVEWIN